MSAALISPIPITAKTPEELAKKILAVQAKEGGKVSIVSIYYAQGQHVCWYLPLQYSGAGVF